MTKFFLSLLFLIFLLIVSETKAVSADGVVINEFLPNPTSPANEWVEFYNPDNIDLTGYWLDDDTSFTDDSGNSAKKSLSSLNTTNPTHPYLELSSFLNNPGDYVVLFSDDGSLVDQYQYTTDPGKDVSIGRMPDGADNWVIFDTPSKGTANYIAPTSTPTPTPTPTSTLTPTLTLTPTPVPITPTSTLTPTPSPKETPCNWACKRAYFFEEYFLKFLFSAPPFKKFWWK